ncbi:MAG: hypothetical protein IPL73_05025 [Candidatus Obscuribacter sp.]|nr:hypothetical protein [Candidatus Obscuribacter sp.]
MTGGVTVIPGNPEVAFVAQRSAVFIAEMPMVVSSWNVAHFDACIAASLAAFQKKAKRIDDVANMSMGKHITIISHSATGISAMVVPDPVALLNDLLLPLIDSPF